MIGIKKHILFRMIALAACLVFGWSSIGQADVVASVFNAVPRSSSPDNMDLASLNLPAALGEVISFHKGTKDHTVVHIVDAHCDYSVQRSIADIISYCNDNYGINLVSLEGGCGDYDLSVFTDIKNKKVRESTADYFVRQGEVNGAEFYALNNPSKISLYGIEDPVLYVENLNAYRNSLKYQDDINNVLKEMTAAISKLKPKIYPQNFKEFDKKAKLFREDKISLEEYFSAISDIVKKEKIDISGYPNVERYRDVINDKKDIDSENVRKDCNILIDLLKTHLPKKYLDEMALKTSAFSQGKIQPEEYYAYLLDKVVFCGIKLDRIRNLVKFIDFAKKTKGINKKALEKELKELETKVSASSLKTDEQKKLYLTDKKLFILERMFLASLAKDDWDYYYDNRSGFDASNFYSFLAEESVIHNIAFDAYDSLARLDIYRKYMEKFYSLSINRDNVFLDKVISKLKKEKQNKIIIVTGGFHQDNLKKLFVDKGYSYVEILPKIEKQDGKSPYFMLISGGADPIIRAITNRQSSLQVATFFDGQLSKKVHDVAAFQQAVGVVQSLASEGDYKDKGTGLHLSLSPENAVPLKEGDGQVVVDGKPVYLSGAEAAPVQKELQTKPASSAVEDVSKGNLDTLYALTTGMIIMAVLQGILASMPTIAGIVGVGAFSLFMHELAHKKTLNWFGVKNVKFRIGFWKKYIPVTAQTEYFSEELVKLSSWKLKRGIVTLAGPLMNLVFAGLFYWLGTFVSGPAIISQIIDFGIKANLAMVTIGSVADFRRLFYLDDFLKKAPATQEVSVIPQQLPPPADDLQEQEDVQNPELPEGGQTLPELFRTREMMARIAASIKGIKFPGERESETDKINYYNALRAILSELAETGWDYEDARKIAVIIIEGLPGKIRYISVPDVSDFGEVNSYSYWLFSGMFVELIRFAKEADLNRNDLYQIIEKSFHMNGFDAFIYKKIFEMRRSDYISQNKKDAVKGIIDNIIASKDMGSYEVREVVIRMFSYTKDSDFAWRFGADVIQERLSARDKEEAALGVFTPQIFDDLVKEGSGVFHVGGEGKMLDFIDLGNDKVRDFILRNHIGIVPKNSNEVLTLWTTPQVLEYAKDFTEDNGKHRIMLSRTGRIYFTKETDSEEAARQEIENTRRGGLNNLVILDGTGQYVVTEFLVDHCEMLFTPKRVGEYVWEIIMPEVYKQKRKADELLEMLGITEDFAEANYMAKVKLNRLEDKRKGGFVVELERIDYEPYFKSGSEAARHYAVDSANRKPSFGHTENLAHYVEMLHEAMKGRNYSRAFDVIMEALESVPNEDDIDLSVVNFSPFKNNLADFITAVYSNRSGPGYDEFNSLLGSSDILDLKERLIRVLPSLRSKQKDISSWIVASLPAAQKIEGAATVSKAEPIMKMDVANKTVYSPIAGSGNSYADRKRHLEGTLQKIKDILSSIFHNLFNGEPIRIYVLGATPTGEDGGQYSELEYSSDLVNERMQATRCINERSGIGTGNINISHTIGMDSARKKIIDDITNLPADMPKERIYCAISAFVLNRLEEDKGLTGKLGKSVKAFLEERTMLNIIDDFKDNKVYLMPYLEATLLGLTRINLVSELKKTNDINSEGVRDAIDMFIRAMALLSDMPDKDIKEALKELLAVAKDEPINFFKNYTFRIALPPITKIRFEELRDHIHSMIEVWRSL